MKRAQYLRVSTKEQRYENQLPDLDARSCVRGFESMTMDAEKVSVVEQRLAFERMLVFAHMGKFRVVLVCFRGSAAWVDGRGSPDGDRAGPKRGSGYLREGTLARHRGACSVFISRIQIIASALHGRTRVTHTKLS
jgi:hypothetical protein